MNSSMELMTPIAIWIDQWMNPLEDLEYFDYYGEFDRLAERVKQGLSEDASRKDIISSINRVMFQEEGYHVNNNFYAHANSYLHNVGNDSYYTIILSYILIVLLHEKMPPP